MKQMNTIMLNNRRFESEDEFLEELGDKIDQHYKKIYMKINEILLELRAFRVENKKFLQLMESLSR